MSETIDDQDLPTPTPVDIPNPLVGAADSSEAKPQHEGLMADFAQTIEKLQQEKKALEDKHMRHLAETENFKRRKAEDFQRQVKLKEEEILMQFLPVVDSFEKALVDMPASDEFKGLKEGILLTERMFRQILEKFDIKRIKSVGEVFDPNVHQAIGQEQREGVASGIILTEVMPGYVRGAVPIRPSLVIVAE